MKLNASCTNSATTPKTVTGHVRAIRLSSDSDSGLGLDTKGGALLVGC